MSLSSEDAVKGALSNIKDAWLCLIDATDIECLGEREELEYVARRLSAKLEEYKEKYGDE